MTAQAHPWRRARGPRPWLALLVVLLPAVCGAAPPADASSPDASPPSTVPGSGKVRIGRIFFSPAERRHRYADKTPATDAPGTARAAHADRLEINGAISSSAQGRAVWVNGTAIENSAKFKSAWTDRAGSVWLRAGRAPRLVRPGQAIDPASGAIEDLLPAGSVARR
jgi:hypothetical protein